VASKTNSKNSLKNSGRRVNGIGRHFFVVSPNSVALGDINYVKPIKFRPIYTVCNRNV